jgi:hypothetical protein
VYILSMLASLIRREPVLTAHVGLTTAVVSYLSFFPGVHLTPVELAAIATILTALTAGVSAFLTKPVSVSGIHTAVTTILVAATAFGLHLSTRDTAVTTTVIVTVLGYLLREKLTPVAGAAVR